MVDLNLEKFFDRVNHDRLMAAIAHRVAEVLKLLGVSSVRLITNHPEKVPALESGGIAVVERASAEVSSGRALNGICAS